MEETGKQPTLTPFLAVVVTLFLLRVLIAYVTLPLALAGFLSLLATFVFVGAPILALFSAAKFRWTAIHAVGFVLLGVALHVGGYLIGGRLLGGQGLAGILLLSAAQAGLMIWCLGLGALVSTKITDKNLLIPIAIFLAGFDVFLVFSPTGPTKMLVQQQPEVFQAVAMSVPKVATEAPPTGAAIQTLAYVGPADLFFLGMFFVALFKFNMRTRQTLIAIIPVLIAYLLVVLYLGGVQIGPVSLSMLPALLPIGLTVLIVNWREFRMTSQEKVSTVVVGLLAFGLAAGGLVMAYRKKQAQPPEPSPAAGVPVPPKSDGSPAPAPSNPPQ
ncbi:MAG: hypothetical protein K1X67_24640 [Fimbriimonadaceae bacterium]|nr:hypothetical protein [Fimbriimonadaceae bacterium]